MRLNNKIALISGSAQGLGAAIARRFAEEGATVFICDMNAEAGNATAAGIVASGGQACFLPLNVTVEQSWIAALAEVVTRYGRLDVLVNNAGINIREAIEEMKEENLDAMLAVNVKGPFLGIKHAIPLLRQGGGGSIINMSSICGLVGHKYTTEAYTITKGAPANMTDTMVTYLYMLAFYDQQKGPATALSVIGFVILCVVAGLYMVISMRKEEQ